MENEQRDPQTYAVIGAAIEVHRILGSGFLEGVYQDAMTVELSSRSIPFQKEVDLPVLYKGVTLDHSYRADFICFDDVLVELKALDDLTSNEEAQIINYLKITRLKRGLLINFGQRQLQFKRFAH